MTQRVIPILSPHFIPDRILPPRPDWAEIFGNDNPMALEIGCGTGQFVVAMARRQPELNFLAIDIYNKGCLKTCAKIDRAGLTNVRVMRVEARWLLAQGLAPESLAAVYINCPDPWPKKRHRRRRLVNRDFLLMIAHFLRPGADFYFSTDFDDYAADVARLLHVLPGYRNRLAENWAHALPDYPVSKYMQRFQEQGLPLYFIHQQRDPGVPRTALPDPAIERGFRVPWSKVEND